MADSKAGVKPDSGKSRDLISKEQSQTDVEDVHLPPQIFCRLRSLVGTMSGLIEQLESTPALSLEQRRLMNSLELCGQNLDLALNVPVGHADYLTNVALHFKPVSLVNLIEEVISLAWNDNLFTVQTTYFFDRTVPDTVIIDGRRLKRVLVSLLSNSFRFTNNGNVVVYVEAQHNLDQGQQVVLRFGVHDTGIGMDVKSLASVFKRTRPSEMRSEATTNLGLELCNFLVGVMGGKMHLESQIGLGTSVMFTVKTAATEQVLTTSSSQAQHPPPRLASSLEQFSISEHASPLPPSSWKPTEKQKEVLSGKRVVVMDGSKFLIRALRRCCEQMGMVISYASVEAYEPFTWLRTDASKRGEFDVVIMDLWQFGMAVTDETLAIWQSRGIALMLMCPTSDWDAAADSAQKDDPRQRVGATPEAPLQVAVKDMLAQIPSSMPYFVSHLPKPLVCSELPDRLVCAIESATRGLLPPEPGAMQKSGNEPQPTKEQESEQQVEGRAARTWQERTGKSEATTGERAAERVSEQQEQKLSSDRPLELIRQIDKHRGPEAQADWLSRQTEQEAAGAKMLHAAADKPEEQERKPPRQPRILVVEDNLVNQRLLLSMLKRLGLKADAANNGRHAVEIASATHYDIILMDVHMPEISGLEATRTILKNYREGKSTVAGVSEPIIVSMSAITSERECLEAGMKDFIGKPFTMATIKEKIDKWSKHH